uniref:MBD_C domain-containing protein n=1 Tax=Syphacia muris TaxID=451379 RepID=A0A0N5AZ79_9BILA
MGKTKDAGMPHKRSKGKDRAGSLAKTGFDGPLQSPCRKTVSIFKQPVTLVHTTKKETKNTTPEQLRRNTRGSRSKTEKPHQLFWAKALEGLQAMIPVQVYDRLNAENIEYIPQDLSLAGKMEPACCLLGNSASAATVCAAIHSHQSVDAIARNPITGQTFTKKQFDANPTISTNVDQPFVQVILFKALTITEQDMQAQERRVLDLRKRLHEARKHFRV